MATRVNWHPEEFLDKLDTDIDSKLKESAEVVSGNAKGLCPVKTGKLQASIHTEKGTEDFQYLVGSDENYAYFVEMGTAKQSPKSFLRTGLDGSVPEIEQIFSSK